MWFQKIHSFGKCIILIIALLLTQCTVTTESTSSIETDLPAVVQLTPSASVRVYTPLTSTVSPTGTEIVEVTGMPINVLTPGSPTQTATSTLVPSDTPTVTTVNEERGLNIADTPLVVSLVHIDPQLDAYIELDNRGVYLARLNGKVTERLTDPNIDYSQPAWSPDCNKIALIGNASIDNETYHNNLFIMELEGNSFITEITTSFQIHSSPTWSPDGKFLAFEGYEGQATQIYTYSLDDQKISQLTTEGNNYDPDWSPDNELIVFTSDRNKPAYTNDGGFSIYIMDAQGNDQRLLLPHFWGADVSSFDDPGIYNPEEPVWSPDGQWIAFRVMENANDYEVDKIYLMTREGLDAQPVVPGDRYNVDVTSQDFYYISERNPKWSPDGQQILYLRSNAFTNAEAICIADVFSGESTCSTIDDQGEVIFDVDWCSQTASE